MCKSILKGQNVPGTDGTYHGTDGTCPRDRRDAHQGGVPPKFFMFIGFFLSPVRQRGGEAERRRDRDERKRGKGSTKRFRKG